MSDNFCLRIGLKKIVLFILIITATLLTTSCSSENARANASSKGFTAEMVSTIDGATSYAKLKVKGSKMQMEVTGGRRSSTMIADYQKQKLWLLIPSTSQYKEFPISAMGNTVPQFFNPNIKIHKEQVGVDKVSGAEALKYKATINDAGKQFEGYLWEAKSLPGYPLKWEDANSKIEVVWEKAKVKTLTDSNFQLPEDYTELKTPAKEADVECKQVAPKHRED